MSTKIFFFLALFAVVALTFTACEKDPCKNKDCGFGVCLTDGACDCDPGYEYDRDGSCKVVVEHKFTGNFLVNETCSNSGTAAPYNVSIGHGASETDLDVLINGFYGPASSGGFISAVKAKVNGKNITIARQEPDGDKFFVEGSGVIDDTATPNKITMSYKVTDESGATTVTNQCNNVVFTKQ